MAGDGDDSARDAVAVRTRHRGIDGPGSAGGDFYVRCETFGRVRLIIGDVRGKGAPAARGAGLVAGAFPAIAAAAADLEQVSYELDRLIAFDAAAEADLAAREWFATAILLEADECGRRVSVINHGHPAPVLVAPGLVREILPTRARLPLGLGELAAADGPPDVVDLPADSALILFTDGVSEARDRAGRMFDPVAWLASARRTAAAGAAKCGAEDQACLLDRLYLEVARHNGGAWHDDLALLSVRPRADVPLESVPPQAGTGASGPGAATAERGLDARAPA
jgi:serine phosphatase RsbU (regulator of sigma subunit)